MFKPTSFLSKRSTTIQRRATPHVLLSHHQSGRFQKSPPARRRHINFSRVCSVWSWKYIEYLGSCLNIIELTVDSEGKKPGIPSQNWSKWWLIFTYIYYLPTVKGSGMPQYTYIYIHTLLGTNVSPKPRHLWVDDQLKLPNVKGGTVGLVPWRPIQRKANDLLFWRQSIKRMTMLLTLRIQICPKNPGFSL